MTVKPIIRFPSLILWQKATEVREFGQELQNVIADLVDTLYSTTGVGLSAPQIGIPLRVCIFDPCRSPDSDSRSYNVLVNPSIVFAEGEVLSNKEGCKSIPGIRVNVKRSNHIHVKGFDQHGNAIFIDATGFEAIVLQHEIDHLDGVLMIDRVDTQEKDRTLWHAHNLSRINEQLKWLEEEPEGPLYHKKFNSQSIVIFKVGSQIQLYFGDSNSSGSKLQLSGIMSRIDIYNPLMLLGIYTQAMMLSLIWKGDPKNIYTLGFGGGRIPMLFHHYFPQAVVHNTELDANVVSLAKKYFGISLDARLSVAIKDGRKFLEDLPKENQYDIILVDCFTGTGKHPFLLSTKEFYDLCKAHLAVDGIIATNLIESDPLFNEKARTFVNSFTYAYDFVHEGAHVFFGSMTTNLNEEEIKDRAQQLQVLHGFEFPLSERAESVTPLQKYKHLSAIGEGILYDKDRAVAARVKQLQTGKNAIKVGRNDPCPCGSGKKYKHCHGR